VRPAPVETPALSMGQRRVGPPRVSTAAQIRPRQERAASARARSRLPTYQFGKQAALGDGVAYQAQQGRSWRPCSLVVRAGRIYGNVKLPKLNVRPSPVSVTFSRLPEISWRFCPGGHVSVDAGREMVRLPVV
jgi:hypothetical protein